MSRKKQKNPFGLSPRTLDRYSNKIAQAESGDTAPLSVDDMISVESGSTDSSLPKDFPAPNIKKKKKNKFIELLTEKWAAALATVVLLLTIGFYGGKLTSLFESTENRITRVEEKMDGLTKENNIQHENINIALVKILERFDRLFDIIKNKK